MPATKYNSDGCTPSVLQVGISSSYNAGNTQRKHADLLGSIVNTEPVIPSAPAYINGILNLIQASFRAYLASMLSSASITISNPVIMFSAVYLVTESGAGSISTAGFIALRRSAATSTLTLPIS